jgi:Ca2+-binding RTX toxin-like protein
MEISFLQRFSLHYSFAYRWFVSALLALLLVLFPAGHAVFAVCVPGATTGNDVITCDGEDDTIDALAGNDTLTGGAGNDTLIGNSGNDTLTGGAGNDTLIGGAGNDSYAFDTDSALGIDTVTEASGGGTDTLNFNGSSNVITVNLGTTGNQFINGNLTLNLTSAQVENVTGGSNNDTLTGNDLNNTLSGGNGNDILDGGAGTDTLTGGAGNDTLTGEAGDDTYSFDTDSALGTDTLNEVFGFGTDLLDFTASSNALTVNLGFLGNQIVNGNLTLNLTAAQVENLTGGSNNDTLTGNTLDNVLIGGNGNDILNGGAGNDMLTGGSGNDALIGGDGNDTLISDAGNDTLTGEAGDDTYTFDTDTALGTDTLNEVFGFGTDLLDFTASSNALTVNLGFLGNQIVNGNLTLNLTAAQVENLTGGSNNDSLTGNDLGNAFSGGNGNDTLNGSSGDDLLSGGAGNDTLNGDSGSDTLDGGSGDDHLNGGTEDDLLNGGDDNDTLNGGDGVDTLNGDLGNDTLNGGDGQDMLNGNSGDDILNGDDGADALDGGDGNDTMTGGAGNDTLTTGPGVDTLDGGADDDLIVVTGTHTTGDSADGGSGVNVFHFDAGTTGILRLISNGEDTLDFSLFGMPVTIDLSNNDQQDIGGGLWLTLSGWFENVIGSAFDDDIRGNDADNTLNGSAGNDTLKGGNGSDMLNGDAGDDLLDGGNGTDALDGGVGNDTVQNYAAADAHANIENGFPTPALNDSKIKKQTSASTLIPVTGGTPILLPCDVNPSTLKSQGNNLALFYNLCGYSILMDDLDPADVQESLPGGGPFLAGISVVLLNGNEPAGELPQGSNVELKFPLPSDAQVGLIAYHQGVDGTWVEVPVVTAEGYARIDAPASGRYVLVPK